ncbi:MAG: cyanophycinase [Bacteroidales bacterium]
MKKAQTLTILVIALLLTCCVTNQQQVNSTGKLFIIGGGNRTDSMMNELIDLAAVRNEGYVYILPMASSDPDSAIIWAKEDFNVTRVKKVFGFNFLKGETPPKAQLDSLRNARLIFICGGDQSRFMSVVLNTPVMDALLQAYKNGSVIAGTSAGAAVMSKKMITGNQKKHPDSESGFVTIESDNIEITRGLGFLTDVIIDQHFIKRQRLNRLVAAAVENPEELCVGIDESTAIIVDGDIATVTGIHQVVVIKNTGKIKNVKDGLLGTEGLQLSVYLPGQKFKIR